METNIDLLQQYLNDRTYIQQRECKNANCEGITTIKKIISKMHIFIDVLFWEGNNYSK